ncbi:inward rectifier potassium channel 2, partial [Asbolus verrucosus]
IHATNRTSIPSVHYIVDAVECLKEAYAIYAEDNDKAKLYSELFQEKHPETEWNVVVGYTAAHIKSQWFVETSVSDDFANTLVLIRWRWVTLIVVLINAFFYVSFAGLWMLDAWLSGDFNATKQENFCVEATRHFAGYLLLSIETITTTGYGYFYPTDHCQIAWIILTLSTIVMILIDGAFISVVFLKICKPPRKDGLSLISKKAVICLRNGKLCLIFRINDNLNKHTIDSKVTAHFIDKTTTEMQNTSYLSEEIFWGYRFRSCMEFDENLQKYRIYEHNLFKISPCDTSLCSAKRLKAIKCELNGNNNKLCENS